MQAEKVTEDIKRNIAVGIFCVLRRQPSAHLLSAISLRLHCPSPSRSR